MANAVQQRDSSLGGGGGSSVAVQSPESAGSTPAGHNMRLRGELHDGIYYFPDSTHQKFVKLYNKVPNHQKGEFIEMFERGAVLIPYGTRKDIANMVLRDKTGMHVPEDNIGHPAGVLVPMPTWETYLERMGGRSTSAGATSLMMSSSSSPSNGRSLRFSSGLMGRWAEGGTDLGMRKKNYYDPEWTAAMTRKQEQAALAARKAVIHAQRQQIHAKAARLSPFGFWHRWRAGHHSHKARLYDKRKQQLEIARERLGLDRDASVLRGDVKNWRDASRMTGASRGDSRVRSLLRTLRA